MKNFFKRYSFSLAFAVVFLPPKKELEDWVGSLPAKTIAQDSLREKTASSSTASSQVKTSPSRFSFNGLDRISFFQNKGPKADWELSLPPVETYRVWESGAWSGISLSSKELHHFYVRAHRRGPEPKYRVYSLSPDWDLIDFVFCSKNEALLLEKSIKSKKEEKSVYRIQLIKMLSSQELKRINSWELSADAGQDFVSIKGTKCSEVDLDGWPKSYILSL